MDFSGLKNNSAIRDVQAFYRFMGDNLMYFLCINVPI